jgi:hypothetical protein
MSRELGLRVTPIGIKEPILMSHARRGELACSSSLSSFDRTSTYSLRQV